MKPKPPKFGACRRPLSRRWATITTGRTTRAVAGRPPEAVNTPKSICLAKNKPKAAGNPVFRRAAPPKTSGQRPQHELRSKYVGEPLSLLITWGFGEVPSHPRYFKGDMVQAGASKSNPPITAGLQVRCVPSLASLVANRCFLTFVRYSTLMVGNNTHFVDRIRSRSLT